jgi:hypothetical protein
LREHLLVGFISETVAMICPVRGRELMVWASKVESRAVGYISLSSGDSGRKDAVVSVE